MQRNTPPEENENFDDLTRVHARRKPFKEEREVHPSVKRMRSRLEAAASTLRRLPKHGTRPGTYKSSMPAIVRDFWDAYGMDDSGNYSHIPPTAKAIDDLDRIADLIVRALDDAERRLVWRRAFRVPWKVLSHHYQSDRVTLWRMYTLAIYKMIACERGMEPLTTKETAVVKRQSPMVYAMQGQQTKAVKIGYSFDPQSRLQSIQTGSAERIEIVATCNGWMPQEKAIHAILAPWRLSGEWFKYEGLVVEAVAKILECDHADQVLQHLTSGIRNSQAA